MEEEHKKGKRYGMVIDLRKCIGCHSRSVACKSEFGVPMGVWRSWVKQVEKGKYPDVTKHSLPKLCNHCDNPPCVMVCPIKATYKHKDGYILQRYDICIGCKYCMVACPYGSRFVHPIIRVIDKCTFCNHRVRSGLVPACVNVCPARARIFGDLNDPESEISRIISKESVQVLKPQLNTIPMVFYIGLDADVAKPHITEEEE